MVSIRKFNTVITADIDGKTYADCMATVVPQGILLYGI